DQCAAPRTTIHQCAHAAEPLRDPEGGLVGGTPAKVVTRRVVRDSGTEQGGEVFAWSPAHRETKGGVGVPVAKVFVDCPKQSFKGRNCFSHASLITLAGRHPAGERAC